MFLHLKHPLLQERSCPRQDTQVHLAEVLLVLRRQEPKVDSVESEMCFIQEGEFRTSSVPCTPMCRKHAGIAEALAVAPYIDYGQQPLGN